MTFAQFQSHNFCRLYRFVPGADRTWRPAGHRLAGVCLAEKEGDGVCLKVSRQALLHPTLSATLTEIVEQFVVSILELKTDSTDLRRAIETGDSLRIGDKTLQVSEEAAGFLKLSLKSKSRFWPFG